MARTSSPVPEVSRVALPASPSAGTAATVVIVIVVWWLRAAGIIMPVDRGRGRRPARPELPGGSSPPDLIPSAWVERAACRLIQTSTTTAKHDTLRWPLLV